MRFFSTRTGAPHDAAGDDGVTVLGLEQRGLVVGVDGALLACQQAGAHLHAASTQRQRSRQLTAIGDAACRDDRHADRIHHLRHQRHGGHLAHMAAALGALGDDGVDAQRLQMLVPARQLPPPGSP